MVGGIGQNDSLTNYMLFAGSMMIDPESGDGMSIGGDGKATPVSPEVVAKTLEAAGMMIVNGKMVGAVDKLEKSTQSAGASLSIGSAPPLPQISSTASPSDVSSSIKGLQFMESIQGSALLMNAMLVLLRGAEEDRKANDEIGNVMFKMKDSAKKGQVEAGKQKVKADLQAAKEQYHNAIKSGIVQIVVSAASAATACVGAAAGAASAASTAASTATKVAVGAVQIGGAVANAAMSISIAYQQLESAKKGAIHKSGEADKNASLYKQVEENAQAVIDITKESSDSCKELWKSALKLLASVEQRATQNVQAFTRI